MRGRLSKRKPSGTSLGFPGQSEIQPHLTPAAPPPARSGPRGDRGEEGVAPFAFDPQNPVELRRQGMAQVAEAAVRALARRALDAGAPERASRIASRLAPTPETLALRAEIERASATKNAPAR